MTYTGYNLIVAIVTIPCRPHKSLLVEKLQWFIKGLDCTISRRRGFFVWSYFVGENGMKSHILRSLSEPCQIAVWYIWDLKYTLDWEDRESYCLKDQYHHGTQTIRRIPNMHKTLSFLIANGWYPDLPKNNYAIGSCPTPNLWGVERSEENLHQVGDLSLPEPSHLR